MGQTESLPPPSHSDTGVYGEGPTSSFAYSRAGADIGDGPHLIDLTHYGRQQQEQPNAWPYNYRPTTPPLERDDCPDQHVEGYPTPSLRPAEGYYDDVDHYHHHQGESLQSLPPGALAAEPAAFGSGPIYSTGGSGRLADNSNNNNLTSRNHLLHHQPIAGAAGNTNSTRRKSSSKDGGNDQYHNNNRRKSSTSSFGVPSSPLRRKSSSSGGGSFSTRRRGSATSSGQRHGGRLESSATGGAAAVDGGGRGQKPPAVRRQGSLSLSSKSNSRRASSAVIKNHNKEVPPSHHHHQPPPGEFGGGGGGVGVEGRLPSTQLKRLRRLSAGTSSSLGSAHNLPTITVTDFSDAETVDDFDPDRFSTSSVVQRTSTPIKAKSGKRDMDLSVAKKIESAESSSHIEETSESTNDKRAGSASPASSKFFGFGRRKGSSSSASSSASRSSKSSKAKNKERKSSAQLRLKKGLLSQNDPKTDAANRWKNIVSEFEEVYNEESQDGNTQTSKEVRRVNKLGNLEQYENVRQVFNRSMPLPMQMAPPGARAQDMEAVAAAATTAAESAASETSGYSWNLMTPMGQQNNFQAAFQREMTNTQAQMAQQMAANQSGGGSTMQLGMMMQESSKITSSSTTGPGEGALPGISAGASALQLKQQQAAASSQSAQEAFSSSYAASSAQEERSSSSHQQQQSQQAALSHGAAAASASASAAMMQASAGSSRPGSRTEIHQEMHGMQSMQTTSSRPSSRQSSRSSSRQSRSASRSEASRSAAHAEMHAASSSSHKEQSSSSSKRKQSSSQQSSTSIQSSASAAACAAAKARMAAFASGKSSKVSESRFTREELMRSRGGKAAIAAQEKRSQMKKGVKFKKTKIDKQAKIIVDGVIEDAMRLFYGDRRKSQSSHKSSASRSSHVEKRVEQHVEEHIHRRASQARQKLEAKRRQSVAAKKEQRSMSMRPQQGKTGQGGMRPGPVGEKRNSISTEMAGLYDMVIQPHGEEQKSEAEMEWYRRLKEGPPQPRNRADTNTTTSIKVYHHDSEYSRAPQVPAYQEYGSEGYSRKTVVDPPTITRGTVTRVFHELDKQQYGQSQSMPASLLLAQLQSLQQYEYTGRVPEEGVQQPPLAPAGYVNSGSTITEYHSYTDGGGMLPPASASATGNECMLMHPPPEGGTLSPTTSAHYSTLQSNATFTPALYDSGPQSIILGNVPGGYVDENIVLSPQQAQSPSAQDSTMYSMRSFRSSAGDLHTHSPHVDVMDTSSGHMLRSLPIVLPHGSYTNARMDDSFLSLPAMLESGEFSSGAYSNEPLIVADLMDKPQPDKHFYSLDRNPHVNMNRKQTLNFYVFGQKEKEEPKPRQEEVQTKEIFFGDETKKVSQGVQVYQPAEPEMPDKKQYTIYHKQTQTLPPPQPPPKSPPPKAKSPPRRIEKKQEKIITKYIPRPHSPERPRSPVVHKETHHYITKERQIEKLPPPPAQKAEFCVQTDMTSRDWEDEVDSLQRALSDAERRALEAERAMEEMHQSNAAIQSVVEEIHEVVHEQERLPTPPPPSPPVREIPVSMEIVKITPEPPPQPEPEPEPIADDDEDEEFYEWTEVEEKEQRLSMAIFEEIEFNLQRTQGGKTTTVESGKSSELIPWAIPDKYEAIVDRRKQKMTQVRDVHREGDDIVVQAGSNIPALTQRLSAQTLEDKLDRRDIEASQEDPKDRVKEQRDVTLKRQKHVTQRPLNIVQRSTPTTSSEVNIQIHRGGDDPDGSQTSRRHFTTAMDYNPKRNYMSTFEREMDRPRLSPPRAKGRTNQRSDKHVPLAAHAAKSKCSTSLLSNLAGLSNPQSSGIDSPSGGKHSTTIIRSGQQQITPTRGVVHTKSNPSSSRHSSTVYRDSLSKNSHGFDDFEHGLNDEPGRRFITTYSQHGGTRKSEKPTDAGSHSTTYVTAPKGSQSDGGTQIKEHHITTYTRQMKGAGEGDASNSSGYSSSDNTSQMKIDRLRGFEIPLDSDEHSNTRYLTEADIHLSQPLSTGESRNSSGSSEKSKRFVSRFDPGNIYFTVPQWTPMESSELLYKMSKDSSRPEVRHHHSMMEEQLGADHVDNDSLPDTLPGVEAEHIKRNSIITKSENQQCPPKVHSEYVEDEDGNLMKITTTEQSMTKTVNYLSEPETPKGVDRTAYHDKRSDEALVEESFVELDLTTTEQMEELHETTVEGIEDEELGEQSTKQLVLERVSQHPPPDYGDEVVAETSVGYKKIEYDDQERSLGLGTDEEAVELHDNEYLYDMRTATLRPVHVRDDKSGELLTQYVLGDSMVTEL